MLIGAVIASPEHIMLGAKVGMISWSVGLVIALGLFIYFGGCGREGPGI